jgi:ketosteroid isomerase-like protein
LTEEHPNVALIKGLDIRNLADCAHLFAPDFVWHYFNPNLPEVEGDYVGLAGLQNFFGAINSKTRGSFKVRPISVNAFGDELVVTHVRNSMSVEGQPIGVDAVVVWRIVDGRIAEAWDIPSAHVLAESA